MEILLFNNHFKRKKIADLEKGTREEAKFQLFTIP